MERHQKGDLVEAIVIAELKHRNVPIAVPFGDNERYDILVETPESELLRAQVKTGRLRDGTVRFDGESQRTNATGSSYQSYQGDVDCFLVYCTEIDSLYLVEATEVNANKTLRIDTAGNNHPRINWADEYEFDRQWPVHTREIDLPPHRRGDATEAHVIAELLKREISIAIPPTDNERFDLLAGGSESDYYRVQIKTGWVSNGVIHFNGVSTHSNGQGNVYKPYVGDVDYFIIYVPTVDELYLIGESEFDSRITLRLDTPDVVHQDINWAENFEFDRNWPPETNDKANPLRPRHGRGLIELVSRKLRDHGILVSQSIDPGANYDLLAETPDRGIYRLSVQTPRFSQGRIIVDSNSETLEEVDHVLAYYHQTEKLYLIPIDSMEDTSSLWLDEPKEIRRTTKWAKDFEFDKNWPPSDRAVFSSKSTIGTGISAFNDLGVEVTKPVGNSVAYDILVREEHQQYHRIAIEPSWPSNGCLRLKPESCDGIDYFLMICRELETEYLIDADDFDRSISLRVEPPEKPDPTIRNARDYELALRWPPNDRDGSPVKG